MYSALVLTLNEENNIVPCLKSLSHCDDIVILDSGSTDRTCSLAISMGARIYTRRFDNFASQRNFACSNISYKNRFVFHLDADERMSEELAIECSDISKVQETDYAGYYSAPRMLWKGQWLKHCTDFPAPQARFINPQLFSFVQYGHGQREAPGLKMGYLSNYYDHEMCPVSEKEWLQKHARYARQEALNHINCRRPIIPLLKEMLSVEQLARRRSLKELGARLPFRGFNRFIYQYIVRLGLLDGKEAFRYCLLLAEYESMIAKAIKDHGNS
jgi:glycosyltransferase involved in cell wall biosynthesis